MAYDPSDYDIAKIRELLSEAFTAEGLRRFCLDRPTFRPVVEEFGPDHGLDDMVDRVLDYCRTKLLWDELLAAVKEANPRQYARFEPRLRTAKPAPAHPPPSTKNGKGLVIPLPREWPSWYWMVAGLLLILVVDVGATLLLWPGAVSTPEPTSTPTNTPSAAETPITPTTTPTATEAPSAGDTWTRPVDGAIMVYVPAGEFLMGSADDDPGAYGDEKPQHPVYLDAFWIDRTEVTNAQYRKCMEAGACEEPRCWDESAYNAPDQPVVCVNWEDAKSYAAWVRGRLPTEAEWEKAARGTDGRIFPWGDSAPDCYKANYEGCADRTLPVGSHPDGASPYGALDMAGNVWEWMTSLNHSYPYQADDGREDLKARGARVLRGGSFFDAQHLVRCAVRKGQPPHNWRRLYGFRVVVAPGFPSGL